VDLSDVEATRIQVGKHPTGIIDLEHVCDSIQKKTHLKRRQKQFNRPLCSSARRAPRKNDLSKFHN